MGLFGNLLKNKFDKMNEKELETCFKEADHKGDLTTINKIVESYLKRQPNYNYLKKQKDLYIGYIVDSVILFKKDYTLNNKFLLFITKINSENVPIWTIMDLYKKGLINFEESFLSEKSLYNDTLDNIDYRLKALIYANNPNLQMARNADKIISVKDLSNADGSIKSAEQIRLILNNITIELD